MPCYHPLSALQSKPEIINPKTGKSYIFFPKKPGPLPGFQEVKLPCGRCIGCRLERSRQWAVRCVHEASRYENNCFITLTFNDENLNPKGTLVKADFQNFMKRLRKHFFGNSKGSVRYFHCGEYGEKLSRPHHHACLFNLDFEDKELWQTREGVRLYRSPTLEKLWPFGFSTLGAVTFESAAYVARYVTKKITGKKQAAHYSGLLPEYVTMSRRPGIAHDWIQEFKSDIYPADTVITRNGIKMKPPRYYDKIFDISDAETFAAVKQKRVDRAKANPNNTPERLRTREEIATRRNQLLKRGYENAKT